MGQKPLIFWQIKDGKDSSVTGRGIPYKPRLTTKEERIQVVKQQQLQQESQYVNYSRVFLLADLKSTALINKERDHSGFSLRQIKKESKSRYLR